MSRKLTSAAPGYFDVSWMQRISSSRKGQNRRTTRPGPPAGSAWHPFGHGAMGEFLSPRGHFVELFLPLVKG
jgi:hypothetical protein